MYVTNASLQHCTPFTSNIHHPSLLSSHHHWPCLVRNSAGEASFLAARGVRFTTRPPPSTNWWRRWRGSESKMLVGISKLSWGGKLEPAGCKYDIRPCSTGRGQLLFGDRDQARYHDAGQPMFAPQLRHLFDLVVSPGLHLLQQSTVYGKCEGRATNPPRIYCALTGC